MPKPKAPSKGVPNIPRTFDRATGKPLTAQAYTTYMARGFVAVDPGAKCGLAFFDESRELVGVTCVDHEQALSDVRAHGGIVICELPRVYPMQASRVDPNDLIVLALKVGHITAHARAYVLPEPAQWKRQVAKEITAQRSVAALLGKEKARCANFISGASESWMHNGLDALAIGLWALGRVDFGAKSPLALL